MVLIRLYSNIVNSLSCILGNALREIIMLQGYRR